MKTISSLLFFLFCNLIFCQNYPSFQEAIQNADKKNKTFKSYPIFSTSNQKINPSLIEVATDIEPISINKTSLLNIQKEKPEFIHFEIIHANDTLSVKMQKHQVVTDDFKVRNQDDKILSYSPGLYYRGIVNDDRNTLAVFNFFEKNLNGIISEPYQGNRIVAQLKNSDQYIIYNDSKMTIKNDFICDVDELEQIGDLIPPSEFSGNSTSTENCVKVFYELTNDIYTNNSSSVDETTNWITSVHNIVATLFSNSDISTALSEVLIWQEEDPYTGSNLDKLEYFRNNRIAFNGDLGHLIDLPVSGGVAYLNSLCSEFRHAFSGLSLNYQELPTYSWTINVITHEMGHSLGSPHTHACFWNGDSSAIDSCGPNNGYSEGCDDAEIPDEGGTVMSYCHLDAVGMNLALGFHPQVKEHMSNTIDNKPCLGTDCIDSCMRTIAGLSVDQSDLSAFTLTIEDVISNSWTYSIHKLNTPTNFLETTDNEIVYTNLESNTYYEIIVANNCSNGNFGGVLSTIFLTDDNWCEGRIFSDTGGLNGNYRNNESLVKTFYPNDSENKISFTINDFDLENGNDFMTIYDGESSNSPVFDDGELLTGNDLDRTFFEATNPQGAITVEFNSNFSVTRSGWEIYVSCETLSSQEFADNDIRIYPNPFETNLIINSSINFDGLILNDMNGKQIHSQEMNSQSETTLDLSYLHTGVYFITFYKNNTKFIKRIIKK